jgi:hypothetical protein
MAMTVVLWGFYAFHEHSEKAADAVSYCVGSLLWSAFFFMLGYLAAVAVQVARESLGRHRDNT